MYMDQLLILLLNYLLLNVSHQPVIDNCRNVKFDTIIVQSLSNPEYPEKKKKNLVVVKKHTRGLSFKVGGYWSADE